MDEVDTDRDSDAGVKTSSGSGSDRLRLSTVFLRCWPPPCEISAQQTSLLKSQSDD